MNYRLFHFLALILLTFSSPTALAQNRPDAVPMDEIKTGVGAQKLYAMAQRGKWYQKAQKWNPEIIPTSDNKSFLVKWQPRKNPPKNWMVSLHGTQGFATDELGLWAEYLAKHDVGFIGVQWWLGGGDGTSNYYDPHHLYREIDIALRQLGIGGGNLILHGFSRGSANIYAIAAMDRMRPAPYFKTVIANAGAANIGYPPTGQIANNLFGKTPFAGQRWITSCGGRDENPDRDGCPAMRKTAAWVESMGGQVILQIEDPNYGHGALTINPKNIDRAMAAIMRD